MEEYWLPVFGLKGGGYEVSNLGRIRSLKAGEPHILAQFKSAGGRLRVTMYLHEDISPQQYRHYAVHRVVAATFMCPVGDRDQINHIDGDPDNNRLDNLEWCTQLENQQHARQTGLVNQHGDNSVLAKFTADDIARIRSMRQDGATYREIRRSFPMAKSTLSYILNGRTYRNLQ